MSSREELFATLQAQAVELGWQIMEPYDGEGQVEMLLVAPGACEQVIAGTMLQARKQLNELGGPGLYPAVEEYDLPAEEQTTVVGQMVQAQIEAEEILHNELLDIEDKLVENETVQAVAEAMGITTEDAADHLAYEENDPEWAKEWQELLVEEAAAGEISDEAKAVRGQAKRDELYDRIEANAAREVRESEYAPENPRTDEGELRGSLYAADEADEGPAFSWDPHISSVLEEQHAAGERMRATMADRPAIDATFEQAVARQAALAEDAAGEAEAALSTAVEACAHQRDMWDVRLERARDTLDCVLSRNVVQDENEHVGVDGLHEDISPFGPTLKELWRGEVARPEQFLEVTRMAGKGRRIIARNDGGEVKVFGSSIMAEVKAELEAEDFAFFSVTKARANELARNSSAKVAAQRTGRAVTKSVDGREVAPKGYRIRVEGNGLPAQFFKSVNEAAWEGFEMRLVRMGA